MGRKLNFNNNLSDITCDKDLVVENDILKIKLQEAGKDNTFLSCEVKDFTVLLNDKIQMSSHNFEPNTKEWLLQEILNTQVQSQFGF